ncbi:MAG: aminoglycoside phosphotransferase family protein [Actinomycetota bacterium]|nr:aminoglycoside phosphotransferase family protein [Actinomycetota bacterium]
MRMHPDQVDVRMEVVAGLVASQFPEWRNLPVRPVLSHGTVNALFRLGDELVLRFPLQPSLEPALREELIDEQRSAALLAPHLPLPVPEPIALGDPGEGYPGPWTAYRWIPGEIVSADTIHDPDALASDLAAFVNALHSVDTGNQVGPEHGRGGPLQLNDERVRRCITQSAELVNAIALERVWARCLDRWAGDVRQVWIHADLMPGNLVMRDGRLAGVIDFGAVRIGDPAVDLMPAWNLLPAFARDTYRRALGVDNATWERGRGWAIVQAIVALPYYVHTNTVMADTARRTIGAVLE